MNKRNKGGQHFRKKVEKNKRERAIENKKKLERLVKEAAAEKLARSFGKKKGLMNRKSRHGQSFRKKVEKNKRERAIQNAKKQERLKALKRERLNALDDGRDK